MVGCGSKNKHRKGQCLEEIGLHAQNVSTVLDAIVTLIVLILWRNLHVDSEHDLEIGYGHDLDLDLNLLINSHRSCVSVSYEKWVQREMCRCKHLLTLTPQNQSVKHVSPIQQLIEVIEHLL